MIPILYESTETSFSTNGIGRLADAISCVVTEERNGMYELEMDYPQSGIHYDDIQLFRLIYAIPADGKSGQPFEIYDITKPLNGVVTVRAWHISYRLNRAVVGPFEADSCVAALAGLKAYSYTDNITDLFTFSTDKNVVANFKVKYPQQIRALLAGQQGSILDVYGTGEYEFDKFTVNLWTNRGVNNGVTIRYGKNLTELTAETDIEPVYTGIVPYYYNEESGKLVTLQGETEWSSHRGDFPIDMARAIDLSDHWPDKAPTKQELLAAAQAYLDSNEPWELDTNLRISFAALSDTEEYKGVSALQRINLCDTVTVYHEGLGVSATAKVVTTVYDVLLERYNEIEIGSASSKSLGQVISDQIREDVPTTSMMQEAIANGTAMITGNSGGYVVLKKNANGQPEELLVMDDPDIEEAENVWRFNNSGLGFSSNGYDGPYETAWTIDGTFYANWIKAGTMSANRVRTGTITSYDGLVSIVLGDENTAGKLIIRSGNLRLDQNGNLTITGTVNAAAGNIGGWRINADRLLSIYQPTSTIPGYRIDLLVPDAGDPPTDIGANSAILVRTHPATSGDPNWGSDSETTFRLRYNGALLATNANVTGTITANNGKLGGANGLVIKEGYGFYTGSHNSYESGNRGMYCGIDGMSFGQVDLGGGKKFPLIQFDYGENATGGGRVYVFRLDFVKETSSSPYWTPGHSFVVDDRMRITTGAGMNIGNSGYNTAGGEYDTVIGGTTYANVSGTSDRRIKKNIRELSEEESVDFIMNCKPVRFEYVNGNYPAGVHHGLIAQDVQNIAGDWAVVGGSEDSVYALGYTEMIADLIKTVQNQEKRIKALEAALGEQE